MIPGRRKVLRRLIFLVFILSLTGCFIAIIHITSIEKKHSKKYGNKNDDLVNWNVVPKDEVKLHHSRTVQPAVNNSKLSDNKIDNGAMRIKNTGFNKTLYSGPDYRIHVFYYPWYGNPEFDGQFLHWNHRFLEHWDKGVAKRWKSGIHSPVDDIGSNFYPELGCYSSRDPKVIDMHMQQMYKARIGVVVVSWYPPGKADNEGHPSDDIVPLLLDAAEKYELKVALHSEPYKGRDESTVKSDLQYIINRYGKHPAFYRYGPKALPLVYLYDSYLTPPNKWKSLLKPEGRLSIRGTDYDAILIALLVEQKHLQDIYHSGFDGFYTYFAATGFTFGSSYKKWAQLAQSARNKNLLFVPSVGPGYIDENIRPWNGENTRSRIDGAYYETAFKNAIQNNPDIISITSFNEWHEGSQIEPAIPKSIPGFTYLDYGKAGSDYYLDLTRKWVGKFVMKNKF